MLHRYMQGETFGQQASENLKEQPYNLENFLKNILFPRHLIFSAGCIFIDVSESFRRFFRKIYAFVAI